MAETRDKLLSNAGALLIAAGAIAAFTGGSYGLSQTRPGLVVYSVVLLMGYGIVGYLLLNRGAEYFEYVMPGAAILVLGTLVLFQLQIGTFLQDEIFRFVLEPALTLMLAFAAGALLTHVLEETTLRVAWPGKGASSLNAMLHIAAYSPIWNAFTLLAMLGRNVSPGFSLLVVGGSVLVAIACVVGGYASARASHPMWTVLGGGLGFVASVMYLFQFMLMPGRDLGTAFFGQFNALVGLVLTGLPVAIATVAWIQVANEPTSPAELNPPPQIP